MFSDPAFWVAIAFIMFIAAVFKPIGKLASSALDDRAGKIRTELEDAEQLREEAQELLATYERKQRQAVGEAEEIVAHARRDAERLAESAMVTLENALARREKAAIERIALAEAAATDKVRDMAVDIAIEATRQVFASRLLTTDDGLIDAAIEDLPKRLN